jgi:hypothetical protein
LERLRVVEERGRYKEKTWENYYSHYFLYY